VGSVRLAARDGSPLRAGRAILLSVAWGIGAGLGVALGAVLTSVSGAGAPGLSGLDVTSELIVVPWLAAIVVVLLHLFATVGVGLIRGRRSVKAPAQEHEGDQSGPEYRVDGHVGTEVPSSQE
jgi:hypothetical protein